MIRYNVPRHTIEAEVDALSRTWRKRAATRTKSLVAKGGFNEKTSIWSEIKAVYIRLQNRKCAFCERQFESEEVGAIEYDVEHFRPKSAVKSWPPKSWERKYKYDLGGPSGKGYFWLAYDLGNYAAACGVCNTKYKSSYFPIANARVVDPAGDIGAEAPFLCYPIGEADEDPQSLITFNATTAAPLRKSGKRRRRAEVIIDFFGLNAREQLHKERARMIALVGSALERAATGADAAEKARVENACLHPSLPHANCVRAFYALWQTDETQARRTYAVCQEYALGP